MNEVSSLQDRLATAANMIIVREPGDQRVRINNQAGDELVSIWWRAGSDIPTEDEAVAIALEEAISGWFLSVSAELEGLRKLAALPTCRDELAGKVVCDLELFESLRDSALVEADQHRQSMAGYRPERQQLLDQIVERCDRLIADATDQRENQNLTRQASDQSND